jgi:hypothetical protein
MWHAWGGKRCLQAFVGEPEGEQTTGKTYAKVRG